MSRYARLSVLVVALAVAGQVFGASQISYRPAGDVIDFTSFSDGQAIANPLSLPYSGGTAEFSMPGGSFQRRTQSFSWAGNFASGDALLWTNENPGPLTIEFSSGIEAFATQIDSNFFGTGTASLWAYDASDTLLGSFTIPSVSQYSNDNSATLMGIAIDPGDNSIAKVVLNIGGFAGTDFAINRVSLDSVAVVPAPGALLLVGLGSGVVGWLRRRRAL